MKYIFDNYYSTAIMLLLLPMFSGIALALMVFVTSPLNDLGDIEGDKASGRRTIPIVIGRDHLDTGSVASPNRETEAMPDGSDAVADWPILNALVNTAGGASWVSLHHGGGVGMGYSIHAGMVIVADGTDDAAAKLSKVLRNDPGLGVIRHADAGYDVAKDYSRKFGLDLEERLK